MSSSGFVARVAAGVFAVALTVASGALASAGCSSTNAAFATGCSTFQPDAGQSESQTCVIGWACTSGNQIYELNCVADPRPNLYDCSCANGTVNTRTIVVDTFVCTGEGALPVANMGCNFNIQE